MGLPQTLSPFLPSTLPTCRSPEQLANRFLLAPSHPCKWGEPGAPPSSPPRCSHPSLLGSPSPRPKALSKPPTCTHQALQAQHPPASSWAHPTPPPVSSDLTSAPSTRLPDHRRRRYVGPSGVRQATVAALARLPSTAAAPRPPVAPRLGSPGSARTNRADPPSLATTRGPGRGRREEEESLFAPPQPEVSAAQDACARAWRRAGRMRGGVATERGQSQPVFFPRMTSQLSPPYACARRDLAFPGFPSPALA